MTEEKRQSKKAEPGQPLRIAAIGAIIITAFLAVGIIDTVFSPRMSNPWAIAVTGLIFFILGIAGWELVVNRTGKVRRKFEKHAEILEDSRDTFRTIAGSVPFPLAMLCDKGQVGYFNKMFASLFDLQEGDSPDLDIHDLIHPEDRGNFRLAFFDCMRYRNFTEKTEVRLSKDGNVRYYEALLRPLSSKVDDANCCLALFRDLSSEKAFAKAMFEPQQINEDQIEQSSAGIFVVNRNGEIESINEAAEKILELDSTHFEGKSIFDDDLPVLEQLGISALLGEKAPNHSIVEIRVGRFMEKSITCSLSIWPSLDNEGDVTRTFFMIQNLTSELQNQADLNTSKHGRYFLFNEAGDAIFVLNSNGEITMANPSAVELTGYDTDELTGMNFSELFTAEEREKALRQSSWLKRKRKINFESKFLDANGRAIDVEISASMVKNSDSDEIILDVVRDIRERIELMNRLSQTQKMETIGEMAKGLALDFNNTLEAIIGSAELAREKCAADEQTDSYLEMILSAAKRGANLTKHLMNYSRQNIQESELLDLNDVIAEAVSFLEQSFERNIRIETKLDENIGPVSGDKSMILQAIINLALNSKDAMPDGGEITVSTSRFDASENYAREHPGMAPGPYIQLMVQDTGVGIEEDAQKKILEPFYTTKEDVGSAGLGLPMVYNTVKAHGGNMDVRSVPYGGTEVRLFFPSPVIPDDLEKRIIFQKSPQSGIKIMVVDDEDVIQTVIEGILKQLGYEVIRAQSGKEALEYLTDNDGNIDLILLDMIMPGLSGWDVFRRLKQFWPDIPVIVVTGYAQEEHLQYMLEEGLEGLIQKPFKASLLSEKIEEVLSSKNQR